MPFKSEAQRRALWDKAPGVARRWAGEEKLQHDYASMKARQAKRNNPRSARKSTNR